MVVGLQKYSLFRLDLNLLGPNIDESRGEPEVIFPEKPGKSSSLVISKTTVSSLGMRTLVSSVYVLSVLFPGKTPVTYDLPFFLCLFRNRLQFKVIRTLK